MGLREQSTAGGFPELFSVFRGASASRVAKAMREQLPLVLIYYDKNMEA